MSKENLLRVKQISGNNETLRDALALEAMSSIIISNGPISKGFEINASELSKDAYKIADAMMEARNNNK